MSLIVSWLIFPLLLAAVGAGWGVLVERLAGVSVGDALLIPLGLASVIVVAGTLTGFSGGAAAAAAASAAAPLIAAGAVVGLALAWPRLRALRLRSPGRWPLIGAWPACAAIATVIAYGAAVIFSGEATFTGIVKLDDTSTWLNVVDIIMAHGRSVQGLATSTFSLTFSGDIGASYPLGAFVILGVGHVLSGIDAAWIFQPYLACCGGALALAIYAIVSPMVRSRRLCALVAFLAAQPALLYGYSLWGGIKEMSAAFLLALGVALAAEMVRAEPAGSRREALRRAVPLGVAGAAMIQVLGIGAGGWVGPALVVLVLAWALQVARAHEARMRAAWLRVRSLVGLAVITAAAIVPVWVALANFLSHDAGLFSEGQSSATRLGNLLAAIDPWQVVGIWPVGDFRLAAPTSHWIGFVVIAVIAAAAGVVASVARRRPGVAIYAGIAMAAIAMFYVAGATPWVTGKALAISTPAILTAALAGAAMLVGHRRRVLRVLGPAVITVIGLGVIWSNVLAYNGVTLAPRARLAELQHIDGLIAGRGPTFVNFYEVYADRHFLREGAPTEPAEYRAATLALRDGAVLTKAAWAGLNAFPPAELMAYRSIVTQRSPAESRPPAIYKLVYMGRFYELWQRPAHPRMRLLEQVEYGESNTLPYCGAAENAPARPLCSTDPVSVPSCPQVMSLAATARADHGSLVAYQRPAPIVMRGDQVRWPGAWIHEEAAHALVPDTPGTAVGHVEIQRAGRYELYLAGEFARGVIVSVDGRTLGRVQNQLSGFESYAPVASVQLSAGVHSVEYAYPSGSGFPEILEPGSGWNEYTTVDAVLLEPLGAPRAELVKVSPARARSLCGRELNWIDLLAPS